MNIIKAGFFLTFLLMSKLVFSEAEIDCKTQHCLAVVDVGSTGSRLHLFQYTLNEDESPAQITEVWLKKVQPGFSSLALKPKQIENYLNTLFLNAPQTPFPVYFFATAGMRLLPEAEQAQRYALVKEWFSRQSNWQLLSAKTLTGKEEGLLAWLSAYTEQKNAGEKNLNHLGIMDMGGASVQIVFPLAKHQNRVNRADQIEFVLDKKPLRLFVHSFLGLGHNEVAHQFTEESSCFSAGYPLSNGTAAMGNLSSCLDQISILINSVHQVDKKIKPLLIDKVTQSWYILGGLPALAQEAPFQLNNNIFLSLQEFITKAQAEICEQPWLLLKEKYPNNQKLSNFCFLASYYYALMVNGYGIQAENRLHYFSDVNKDWTQGALFLPMLTKQVRLFQNS